MDVNSYIKTPAGADIPWTSDDKPRVAVSSYGYDVAEGNISGHTVFFKTGYNSDVDAAEEDMWAVGGQYVWLSSATSLEIVSDSAADTTTGTGLRTVTISYLDGSYTAKSETISLTGTTPATTVATDIYRINAFRATTTGTSYVSQGNVDITNLAGDVIYSRIATGQTRARNSIYTVPSGKTLYVTQLSCSIGHPSGGRSARFTLRATYNDVAGATTNMIFFPYYEIGLEDAAHSMHLDFPIKFPAKTDVKFSVIGDAGNADAKCTCAYRGWLE